MKLIIINEKGMMLLDILIAVAILLTIFLPLNNLFLQSRRISENSSNYLQALTYAQGLLENEKREKYDRVQSVSENFLLDSQKFPQWKYEIIVEKDIPAVKMKKVTVIVHFLNNNHQSQVALSMLKIDR